jgi:hypothetical protein
MLIFELAGSGALQQGELHYADDLRKNVDRNYTLDQLEPGDCQLFIYVNFFSWSPATARHPMSANGIRPMGQHRFHHDKAVLFWIQNKTLQQTAMPSASCLRWRFA